MQCLLKYLNISVDAHSRLQGDGGSVSFANSIISTVY